MPKRPNMIPLREASEMIGCSRATAQRLAYAGDLEWFTLKEHGWMLVERASVVRFLSGRARQKKNGSPKPGKDRRQK